MRTGTATGTWVLTRTRTHKYLYPRPAAGYIPVHFTNWSISLSTTVPPSLCAPLLLLSFSSSLSPHVQHLALPWFGLEYSWAQRSMPTQASSRRVSAMGEWLYLPRPGRAIARRRSCTTRFLRNGWSWSVYIRLVSIVPQAASSLQPTENTRDPFFSPPGISFQHIRTSPGSVKPPTTVVAREILNARTERYNVRERGQGTIPYLILATQHEQIKKSELVTGSLQERPLLVVQTSPVTD